MKSRVDILEVSLQLLDASEWRLAAYGGFCRKDKSFYRKEKLVFEALSILYAVGYVESNYLLGRLLILCNGRSHMFTLLSFMRRIFASGFRVFHADTVRIELFRQGTDQVGSSRSCTAFHTVFADTNMRPRLLLSLTDAPG